MKTTNEPKYKVITLNSEAHRELQEIALQLTMERGLKTSVSIPATVMEMAKYFRENRLKS